MKEILSYMILGNTVEKWAIAIGIIAGCLLLCKLLQTIVIFRIRKFSTHTKSTLDDFIVSVLQRSVMPFLYILSVYGGVHYLWIDPRIQRVLKVALLVVSVFFVLRIITDTIA